MTSILIFISRNLPPAQGASPNTVGFVVIAIFAVSAIVAIFAAWRSHQEASRFSVPSEKEGQS
jgi:hypothetical protein